jgi:hypothetical protein
MVRTSLVLADVEHGEGKPDQEEQRNDRDRHSKDHVESAPKTQPFVLHVRSKVLRNLPLDALHEACGRLRGDEGAETLLQVASFVHRASPFPSSRSRSAKARRSRFRMATPEIPSVAPSSATESPAQKCAVTTN